MNKPELRRHIKLRLAAMTDQEKQHADAALVDGLKQLPQLTAATAIAAFLPILGEPNIRPLLKFIQASGVALYLPRWCPDTAIYEMVEATPETTRGPHGAHEPSRHAPSPSREQLNKAVWLIPGLAFDAAGNRLGRGGGFYDRLLAQITAPLIGVAYHNQLCESIPVQLHDIRMQTIVTDTQTIVCTPPKKEQTPWNILLDSSPALSSASSAASLSKKQQPPIS